MRLTSGIISLLIFTVGALVVVLAVEPSNQISNRGRRSPTESSFLRRPLSANRRYLYNYSRNNNINNNYNANGGYNGDYSASSAYMNPNYANNDGGYGGVYGGGYGYGDGSNQQQNYGNNYANYQDNGYNNNQNYQNQNYDNSNYIWQRDDDDNYKNDDASNYYQNSNNQNYGNYYNGRGQSWGGQEVQAYSDDEVPVVTEEGMEEEDQRWEILGKFGGLSAKETVAVSVLAAVVSIFILFLLLLACGCNVVDLIHIYCCCGVFGHVDETNIDSKEAIEDGFVKIEDY